LFEPVSFGRVVLAAIVYGGIEYRYVNRREAEWTKSMEGFYEKPVIGKYSPYQIFFLLPFFVVVSYTPSTTAWAANLFLIALLQDISYFAWRGTMVEEGEWTTQLFGSFRVGRIIVPIWWPLDAAVTLALYATPVL